MINDYYQLILLIIFSSFREPHCKSIIDKNVNNENKSLDNISNDDEFLIID